MKRLAKFVASLALAGLLLFALLRHFNASETMASVRQAHPGLLMLGFTLMVAAYLLRGARWQIWERSLGYWDSLRLILIGFMGNNILPGRLGEILRAHCAAAQTEGDRGRTAFLASIAAERILDGLILSVFGLTAIGLVHVDRRLEGVLILVSCAFAGLTSGLVLGTRHHHAVRSVISTASRWLPRQVTAFAQEKAAQFLDGFLPLGTLPRMVGALAATFVIWGIEVASYYCFGLAVWGGMSVRTALLSLVVVNFASLIPLTMGGIGTIDAAGPLFLISSGVTPHIALAMVLLQHAAQYLFTTISGGIVYLAGGFHRLPLARPKTAAHRRPAPATGLSGVEQTHSSVGQISPSVE
jgi:uncharacterized protein (TIRG00374 family)